MPDGDYRYAPQQMEAEFWYAGTGLGKLLYRSDFEDAWSAPAWPEAYSVKKELAEVYGHPLHEMWNEEALPELCAMIDGQKIHWSTVMLHGFRKSGVADRSKRVVVIVSVYPGQLSPTGAHASAKEVLAYLKGHGIEDVFVEYMEAAYHQLAAGPELLPTLTWSDATASVRSPLTTNLGLPIGILGEHHQGTFGLYVKVTLKDEKTVKFGGLTARHVVLPHESSQNTRYDYHPSAPRKHVQLLGDQYYDGTFRPRVLQAIADCALMNRVFERRIAKLEASNNDVETLEYCRHSLAKEQRKLNGLEKFLDEVVNSTEWTTPANRIIGKPFFSPKLACDLPYTEDWAFIELDEKKFVNFQGNKIDLDVTISTSDFTRMMYPRGDEESTFEYPPDAVLPVRGMMTEAELRRPAQRDTNNDPCTLVIKNGMTTGSTIGRLTGLHTMIRQATGEQSCELTIINYDNKHGPFSAPGDSGSIIVNGHGEIAGLLTGGFGLSVTSDVTFATPMFWLKNRMLENFAKVDFFPTAMDLEH